MVASAFDLHPSGQGINQPGDMIKKDLQTTSAMDDDNNLFCEEVLDYSALNKTPERETIASEDQPQQQAVYVDDTNMNMVELSPSHYSRILPPTVESMNDPNQLKDSRILQNLLKDEQRFMPTVLDYMKNIQEGAITPDNRKLVADWMLGIIQEQGCQPDVFSFSMNIMDRFLCLCPIRRSQLQLLGAVCLLLASKIREPDPISGKKLIHYTECSITAEELKNWELLVLYKLQWELTTITPIDYLDQAISRLGLNEEYVDLMDLRKRAETILVLAATDYQFTYYPQSLLAASAIITAIQSLSTYYCPPKSQPGDTPELHHGLFEQRPLPTTLLINPQKDDVIREIKLRLQTVTLTATDHIDECTSALSIILPELLKGIEEQIQLQRYHQQSQEFQPDSTCSPTSQEPDLACHESLSSNSSVIESYSLNNQDGSPTSRSSSPLSAVDIFTEYNTNVLQAIFEQVESNSGMKQAPSTEKSSADGLQANETILVGF